MIDATTIQRIREASNVVDVLGDFLELRKRGTEYECLCPFHDDHSIGSFKVSERKNLYICFACGECGDSIDFLIKSQGYKFLDAVRWLGRKYNIPVEGSQKFNPKPARRRTPPPPLPLLTIPRSIVEARTGNTEGNTLCRWLRSLQWTAERRRRLERVLTEYRVGHSPKGGHTIFWQIDEKGVARTAKLMLYRADGHRDKDTPGNFNWVHTLLARAGRIDLDKAEVRTTFFGMHLLSRYPDADVHIVESEKTALICAAVWGQPEKAIWMACGGKSMLTRQRLQPILNAGRQVTLYPDRDAIDEWEEMAKSIGTAQVMVASGLLRDMYQTVDNPKADMADVLTAAMSGAAKPPPDTPPAKTETPTASTPLQRMTDAHPKLQQFIDTLELKET